MELSLLRISYRANPAQRANSHESPSTTPKYLGYVTDKAKGQAEVLITLCFPSSGMHERTQNASKH